MDAFAEFYHAPVLHAKQSPDEYSRRPPPEVRLRGAALPHRRPAPSREHIGRAQLGDGRRAVKPMEVITRGGLFGPWDETRSRRDASRASILGMRPVGPRLVPAVPELRDPDLEPGLVPHVPLLADGSQHPCLRGQRVLPAGEGRRASAFAQEMAAVTFKEFALQDANTLEATQTLLETRWIERFPSERPGSAAADTSTRSSATGSTKYERGAIVTRLPDEFADLEHFAETWCLADRARALRPAARQHHGRDAGLLRRRSRLGRRTAMTTSAASRSTRCPTTRRTCCISCTR